LLPLNNTFSRFLKGFSYTLFGSVIAQGSVMISGLYLANSFGVIRYGELGILQTTILFFSTFSTSFLGLAPQKFVAEFKHNKFVKFSSVVRLLIKFSFYFSLGTFLLLLTFSRSILEIFVKSENLYFSLIISFVCIFFNAFNSAQLGVLAGLEDYKSIFKINVIKGGLGSLVAVYLSFFWEINGVIIGWLIGACFSTVYAYYVVLPYYKIEKEDIQIIDLGISSKQFNLSKILSFSTPTLLSTISTMGLMWYANSLIMKENNGLKEMGYFNLANQWRLLLAFIPSFINIPFLSIISSQRIVNVDKVKNSVLLNFILIFISTLTSFLILYLGTDNIISLYGVEFSGARNAFIYMISASCLASLSSVFANVLNAKGLAWVGFLLNFLWCLFFVFSLFCLNDYSASGIAKSYFYSYLFFFLITISSLFLHLKKSN
jgi:O-antigen/teichoic acid export membrane protein